MHFCEALPKAINDVWISRTLNHAVFAYKSVVTGGENKEMLSRDCDGCSQMKVCSRRFNVTDVYDKVYCPDGTAHLIDGA